MAIAFTASSALALTACGDNADTQPATATAEPGDQSATSAVESAKATAAEEEETVAADEAATGDDPVFAAMDAVMEQHADAVIVSIDREDNTEKYDIDAVIGSDVVEFKVDAATGDVVEEERDVNEDEANRVANVNVSAHDAIEQALDQHKGAVLDEAELEKEGDLIEWQIDLDDADRNDLAEVKVKAN